MVDVAIAQELLDFNQPERQQRAIDGIKVTAELNDKQDDVYVELFNDTREDVIEQAKIFAKAQDTLADRFHYVDLGSNFPPVISKSTPGNASWNVASGRIRNPTIATVIDIGISAGQWGIKINRDFLEDDIVGHLAFFLTGSRTGNSYTITDNGGPDAGDENDIELSITPSVGDKFVVTTSEIINDAIYSGGSQALQSASSAGTFGSIPSINEFVVRWDAINFLRYDPNLGTFPYLNIYASMLVSQEELRDSLEIRDEMLTEIVEA
jgi:hypothetical protein